MSELLCHLMVESERVEVALRRFTFGNSNRDRPDFPCPALDGIAGHDSGFRVIHDNDAKARWWAPEPGGTHRVRALVAPIDERWPLLCTHCRAEFPPEAERQTEASLLYSGWPDGRFFTRRAMPPGAMYDAVELYQYIHFCGPDGKAMHLVLPDGTHWHIDGPPSGAGQRGWIRTGIPPLLTVHPSILTAAYHGTLANGVLCSV